MHGFFIRPSYCEYSDIENDLQGTYEDTPMDYDVHSS